MAKKGSTDKLHRDPQVTAPAIADALKSVHAPQPVAEEQVQEASKVQEGEQEAEAVQKAAGAVGLETLVSDGLDDAATQATTDPDAGSAAGLGSLADRTGSAGRLQSLADSLTVADAPPGDQAPSGRDSSMFAIGGTFVEGTTAPGAAVAHKTADGEEVDKVVAGDKSQTRDGVTGIPFLGDNIGDALTSAEHSAGTHAGAINQAANSDPTVSTGSDAGSSGSQGSGSDSGSTGDTQGGSDDSTSPVLDESDNEDGSHTTVYDSGDIVTTYPDGTVEHNYPDGTTETDYPDGTLKTEYPDGSTETIHPDGTTETTEATDPPPDDSGTDDSGTDDSGTDDSGTDDSGSDTSGSGDGSGSDTSGSGSGSGSGSDTTGSGDGTGATSAQAGGGGLGGDPGDPETGAPLPADIQKQLDADLAGLRAQRPVQGDGATDPNPDAGEPIDESGPIRDTKATLLGGDPVSPDAPDFGAGAHGGDVGSLAGSIGGLDPLTSDPSEQADTGVQTSGPSERQARQPTPSLSAAPGQGTHTSSGDSSTDSSGGDVQPAVSPLHGLLHTELVPDRLAAADDASDDSGDDADD